MLENKLKLYDIEFQMISEFYIENGYIIYEIKWRNQNMSNKVTFDQKCALCYRTPGEDDTWTYGAKEANRAQN